MYTSAKGFDEQQGVVCGNFVLYGVDANDYYGGWSRRQRQGEQERLFEKCQAMVYMVDVADRDRFAEASQELDYLLQRLKWYKPMPLLILGNKIDHPSAISLHELQRVLRCWDSCFYAASDAAVCVYFILCRSIPKDVARLIANFVFHHAGDFSGHPALEAANRRKFPVTRVQLCSIVHRFGYGEGFRWLREQIQNV